MIILAFDPGSIYTGWAVMQAQPLTYLDSGVFALGSGEFFDRIGLLKTEVERLLSQHQPSVLVLEKAFIGPNKDSSLKLAQIRGALMALCAQNMISCAEYSPREAKKVITGYGAATKEQVALMIERLLKRSFTQRLDETDALSLALCHYFCAAQQRLQLRR